MAKLIIDRQDPQWEQLHKLWLEEKCPGYVVTPGGRSFRVFTPSDDDVLFELMEGIDSNYNSRSTTAISK